MGSTLVRRNFFQFVFASISDFTADARWYSEVHLNERLRLNTKVWWGFRTMRFVLLRLRFF